MKYEELLGNGLRPEDPDGGWFRVVDPGAVGGRTIEVTIVMDRGEAGLTEQIAAIDLLRRMIEYDSGMSRQKIAEAMTAEVKP